MKSNISKEQIANIASNLATSIDKLNIPLINIQETADPLHDIQRMHSDIIQYLSSNQNCEFQNFSLGDLKKQASKNQVQVLSCLRKFVLINEELYKLSSIIHERQYPLSVYKSFRKLYEEINEASTILYKIDPIEQDFDNEKDELINKNLQICSQIVSNTKKQNKQEYKQKTSEEEIRNEDEVMSLKREIGELNQIIRQNDEEFSIEIQRYNHTLYDLQQTIREYEVRLDKVREYEMVVEELEHKLIRMKQEKCRDEMLIENMSKKIRYYQKQRGGAEIFLSPRNKKFMGSPTSRFRSPNMSAINSFQNKSRTYLNERMTSG